MTTALDVARWVSDALFALLGLVAARMWLRRRSPASAWLAATFLVLSASTLVSLVTVEDPDGAIAVWISKLTIVGLVLFPYFLYRFRNAIHPAPLPLRRAVAVATAIVVVTTLLLPRLPDQARDGLAATAYVVAVVVQWVGILTLVTHDLWVAGRGQATLARRRMRLMATAAALLSLAFVALATVGTAGADVPAVSLGIQLVGMAAAVLFVLGFAPPSVLRAAWRQPEEQALSRAAVELMAATSPSQVSDLLLPHMARLVGASGAVLVDGENAPVGPADAAADANGEGVIRLPLRHGRVELTVSPYVPFFGEEEQLLLHRLRVLADLALDRTGLLVREQEARAALEVANEELESFVYSASHDLKNPLIAMLGYLDVLRGDYGDVFDEQGRWYLSRMEANGHFMEALIQDLLELSRVGRMETEPTRVDLTALLQELRIELQDRHPHLDIVIEDVPDLWMNPVRARQLFTNLLDNAGKYAGGEDRVHVTVHTVPGDGETVIAVTDDGIGIPADYRERVFGVFERLDSEIGGKQGTGIGLAICRKIVDALGGRIWVAPSEHGADFRIALPPAAVAAGANPPLLEASS